MNRDCPSAWRVAEWRARDFAFAAVSLMISALSEFMKRVEECPMERRSLTDADISSRRRVSRRTLLRSLGVGAAAMAAIVGAEAAEHDPTKPKQKSKPADPCRDTDHHVNDQDGGCPSDVTS